MIDRARRLVWVLWAVQFWTTFAVNLALAFVPFFLSDDPILAVRDPRDRVVYTSLILGGPFFTAIVATPLWGWVADRTGRKRQVVRATLGLGLTQLAMAFAQSPAQLVAIRMAQGLVAGVVAANLGLLAAATPPERQGRSLAVLQSANPAGQIAGPLVGGVLIATVGFRALYLVLGGLVLATALLAWVLIDEDGVARAAPARGPFADLALGARDVVSSGSLRSAAAVLFGAQVATTLTQTVLALYAERVAAGSVAVGQLGKLVGAGVGFAALVLVSAHVGSLASAARWGAAFDRGRRGLTALGATLVGIATAALALWPPWWAVLVLRAAAGTGLPALGGLQLALSATHVAAERRGQLMGVMTAITHVGNLAGFVAGGAIAARWGLTSNVVLAGAIYLAVAMGSSSLSGGSAARGDRATCRRPAP